jgi:hypothetical protein
MHVPQTEQALQPFKPPTAFFLASSGDYAE